MPHLRIVVPGLVAVPDLALNTVSVKLPVWHVTVHVTDEVFDV